VYNPMTVAEPWNYPRRPVFEKYEPGQLPPLGADDSIFPQFAFAPLRAGNTTYLNDDLSPDVHAIGKESRKAVEMHKQLAMLAVALYFMFNLNPMLV